MTSADSLTPRLANPLVQRLRPYTTTIFAEMSALATATGSIGTTAGSEYAWTRRTSRASSARPPG